MQVMPNTATQVARRAHIPLSDAKQLFTPDKNVQVGTAYLAQLAQRFRNHPILMAAAYNAGPQQVQRWLSQGLGPVDIWVETIPWLETRNYLKNVIAFYAIYEHRMHAKAPETAWSAILQ